MKILLFALPLLLLVNAPVGASAQDIDVTKLPGYVDLEKIEIPADAAEVVDIEMGPELIQVALGVDEETDSKAIAALSKIRFIRVKSFHIDDETAGKIRPRIEAIEKKLQASDWKRVIYIKDREEFVSVHVMHDDKTIVGMMVLVFEPGDTATFANIVGEINFATLIGLANEFGEVDLDEMMEQLEAIEAED